MQCFVMRSFLVVLAVVVSGVAAADGRPDTVRTTATTPAVPPYALGQSFPNPFTPTATGAGTVIRYSIGERSRATIRIYDVNGALVKTLLDEIVDPTPGGLTVSWDGRNDRDDPVGTGVYFYRLVTRDFVDAKKIVVVR